MRSHAGMARQTKGRRLALREGLRPWLATLLGFWFSGHQFVTDHEGVNIAGTPQRGTSPHRANAAHNNTGLTPPATQPQVNTRSSTSQHTTAYHSVFTAVTVEVTPVGLSICDPLVVSASTTQGQL